MNGVLPAHQVDEPVEDRRLTREVVGPLGRPVDILDELETELRIEVADETVLPCWDVRAAEFAATSLLRRATDLLKNRGLEAPANHSAAHQPRVELQCGSALKRDDNRDEPVLGEAV